MEVNKLDPKEIGHGTAFGLRPVRYIVNKVTFLRIPIIAGNLLVSWIITSL